MKRVKEERCREREREKKKSFCVQALIVHSSTCGVNG